MTNKEQYALFCQRNPLMPVTMQPWWLDAVCAGKQWDVLLIMRSELQSSSWWQRKKEQPAETEDEIVAALPYLLSKRLWYKFVVMPQMTISGGLWLSDELQAAPDMQETLAKVLAKKLRELKIAYYYQQYPVGNPMPHWLAKQGLTVEQRVTYRLSNVTDIEAVEDAYSKNKKRQIEHAADLSVDTEMSAEEFYRFHTQCMAERGHKLSYSREFLLVLERKSAREKASQFIRIRQGETTVAAAFVVWDRRYMYYLIPAYLPSASKTGASARLADEAIRLAQQKGLQFDFEGGNNDEGISNHYRQFGAQPATYSSVSKLYRPSFAILLWANKLREKWKRY
jgi:hypothetical protein